MKTHFLAVMLILVFATGCNGIFEVGVENTPATSGSTAISPTILPPTDTRASPTPIIISPSASLQAPTVTLASPTLSDPVPATIQPPTETQAPTNAPTWQTVQIFLIAVDDKGQSGLSVGCGDSAIQVQVQIPQTQGIMKAALTELLSIKSQYYGESGLYNALYQSDLQVKSISINAGKASVYLTGTLMMGGECDAPRVQAQLEQTVLQFKNVTEAAIYINDKPLADILSLK